MPEPQRRDFETLLVEEGVRPFSLEYSAPIGRVLAEIVAYDQATKLPVRPWVLGECCDHIYPTCPAVVRTGRLDVEDGNWRLGTYRTVDDPANVLYLHPDDDGDATRGDVCGWCFRVWRSRVKRHHLTGAGHA